MRAGFTSARQLLARLIHGHGERDSAAEHEAAYLTSLGRGRPLRGAMLFNQGNSAQVGGYPPHVWFYVALEACPSRWLSYMGLPRGAPALLGVSIFDEGCRLDDLVDGADVACMVELMEERYARPRMEPRATKPLLSRTTVAVISEAVDDPLQAVKIRLAVQPLTGVWRRPDGRAFYLELAAREAGGLQGVEPVPGGPHRHGRYGRTCVRFRESAASNGYRVRLVDFTMPVDSLRA